MGKKREKRDQTTDKIKLLTAPALISFCLKSSAGFLNLSFSRRTLFMAGDPGPFRNKS